MLLNDTVLNEIVLNGAAGADYLELTDSFSLTDSYSASQLIRIADTFALASVFSRQLVEIELALSDSFSLSDSLSHIAVHQLTDAFSLSESLSIGQVLGVIADSLGLTDEFLGLITETKSISDTFGLGDSFDLRQRIA